MDCDIWNMIINVKYHEDTAESAWVACDPSSYKAFDNAAIGISIEQVERAGRGGGGAELEIGFEPSRGRRVNRDPQDMSSGEEGRIWRCLCAFWRIGVLVRAPLRGCLGSSGIKCRWMSHRFIPIPVISYLRVAEEEGGRIVRGRRVKSS